MFVRGQVYVLVTPKPRYAGNLLCEAGNRNGRTTPNPDGLRGEVLITNEQQMSEKNKGGRPKKGLSEKLKYPVRFKLCTKDYYDLKTKATDAGMKIPEFARKATINGQIKSRLTTEQAGYIRKLSGMANNFNQLARQANKTVYENIQVLNAGLAVEIYNIIKKMRDDG